MFTCFHWIQKRYQQQSIDMKHIYFWDTGMSWDVILVGALEDLWSILEHYIEWPLPIPSESTCWSNMFASQKSEWFLTLPQRVICKRINTREKPMVPQWCWFWCFWWWSLRITMIKTIILLLMVMDSQEVLKLFRLALQTFQALSSEMISSWLPLTATMRIESGRKRLMCWTFVKLGFSSLEGHLLVILWPILLDARPFQARNEFGLFQRTLVADLRRWSPWNNVDYPPGN